MPSVINEHLMSGNGVLVFSVHKLKHRKQKIRTKNENKNQIIKFIKFQALVFYS